MPEWRTTYLDEVAQLRRGFDLPHRLRNAGPYPVLTAGSTAGWHDTSAVRGPGMVVGRATNLGEPTWSENDFWPLNTTLYVEDFFGNVPRWVFHLFESIDLRGYDSGSVQPMLNRNYISKVIVRVPPIQEQQAIADVLRALDEKIAANAELIVLLWTHLDALFEQALTRGYTVLHLAEAVDFHNHKRVPLSAQEREQHPGQVPYYGATGVFGHVDSAIFHEPLVLVGEDGSVITDEGRPVVQYIWGPSWVNNHAHVLTGASISTELLALALRRADVRHLVTGAVQPKISMGKLRTLTLGLPQGEPLRELEDMCARETALLRATVEESRRLVTLRDTLLPLLMSGKLRVKDAEKQVEEVL